MALCCETLDLERLGSFDACVSGFFSNFTNRLTTIAAMDVLPNSNGKITHPIELSLCIRMETDIFDTVMNKITKMHSMHLNIMFIRFLNSNISAFTFFGPLLVLWNSNPSLTFLMQNI